MKYLFDTNVISEVRHPNGDSDVKSRFAAIPQADLYTSAIVFAELSKGVYILPKGKRRSSLIDWLDGFEQQFSDRILPFDRITAKIHGQLVADAASRGIQISVSDGQIAATAIQNKLQVITRNEKDFVHTGATIWNIWKAG